MSKLRPTSGREWRKAREEGELFPLPSGAVVRIRPVSIERLIAGGHFPDALTAEAQKVLFEQQEREEEPDLAALFRDSEAIYNVVCKAALVEPRIVDDPQADDEIGIDDLSYQEKEAVYRTAQQPAMQLRRFCQRQIERLEAVPDGEGDGDAAE